MATFTTRLALSKAAGTESRSTTPINANSDLIDKFMPCILVNDGVTPPTGDLYDGVLVKERTSGIIWEARKNGGGTFDKVWVRYPFMYDGGTYTAISITTNIWPNFTAAGIATTDTALCKNASSANVVSSRLVLPVKGIYDICLTASFAGNSTGNRGICMELNSSFHITAPNRNTTKEISPPPGGTSDSVNELSFSRLFLANDSIAMGVYQNSGVSLNLNFDRIRAALIEPVQ
jgi:hypothetical protein